MENTQKDDCKQSTVADGVTETAKLVFEKDGEATKQSLIAVIPSILEKLDRSEVINLYELAWSISANNLLLKLAEESRDELKEKLAKASKEIN